MTTSTKHIKQSSLNHVLDYENQDVIDRYVMEFGSTEKKALLLFDDVKRWLWLCNEAKIEIARGRDIPLPTIFDEQIHMDNMWHTFILFTPAYVNFCFKFFGAYLHHEPTPERVKQELRSASKEKRMEEAAKNRSLKLAFTSYTFDKLGEEVARRWYLDQS